MPVTPLRSAVKTPRTQRRRRIKPKTSNDVEKSSLDTNNKENQSESQHGKSSKSRAERIGYEYSFSEDYSQESVNSDTKLSSKNEMLRRHFLKCLKDNSVAQITKAWKDNVGLVDYVIHASCSKGFARDSMDDSDKEYNLALITACRKLIKEATALEKMHKSKEKNAQLFSCLFVACHSLRATSTAVDDQKSMEQLETIIRLLYHLIHVTSEAAKQEGADIRLALIILAGYETLQHKMLSYSCPINSGKRRVSFAIQIDNYTVSPIYNTIQKKDKGTESMTLRQISTIALKTTIAAANSINKVWQSFSDDAQSNTIVEVFKSISLYGEFCTFIMKHVRKRQGEIHPLKPMIQLMNEVYMEWLVFLAESSDEECLNDLLSNCKAAHRILWDAASLIKNAKYGYHQDKIDEYCLQLRMHAILMLLPDTKEGSAAVEVNVENACTYAWKAASVYAQTRQSSLFPVAADSALSEYHRQIGTALNRVQALAHGKALPFAYVEYSTYRMLHTGIYSPNTMALLEKERIKELSVNQIVLGISLLAVLVNQDFNINTKKTRVWGSWKQLVEAFELQVIPYISKDDNREQRIRSFKLLTMLSLHRSVYLAQKEEPWIRHEKSLHIACIVLIKCIGPLALVTSTKATEATKSIQAIEMAVECFTRSLSVLEKLAMNYFETDDKENFKAISHFSDKTMQHVCHYLLNNSKDKVSMHSIEKGAKALSIISRQRVDTDRHQESLLPQLLSLRLYQKSMTLAADRDSIPDYQLPIRLTNLASQYQTVGRCHEASFVLALVLSIEMSNGCYASGNKLTSYHSEDDFTNFLASKSKGVLVPRNDYPQLNAFLKSTVRRFVSLVCDSFTQPSLKANIKNIGKQDLNLCAGLDLLLESNVGSSKLIDISEDDLELRFSITELLRAIFMGSEIKAHLHEKAWDHVMLLTDILVQFGRSISSIDDSPMANFFLNDYEELSAFIEECIVDQCSFGSSFNSEPLLSLLNLVASTSLLPYHSFYEDTIQGTDFLNVGCMSTRRAKVFGAECCQTIENYSEEWRTMISPLKLGTMFYYLCLKSDQFDEDYPSIEILELIDLCKDEVKHVPRDQSGCLLGNTWMKWILMNLQNRLEFYGDTTRATMVAFWALTLVDENNFDEKAWFGSVAISSYLKTQPLACPSTVSLDEFFPESEADLKLITLSSIARHEFLISKSSLQGLEGLEYSEIQLDTLKAEIEQSDAMDDVDQCILLNWLLSTIALKQIHIARASGRLLLALDYIKSCANYCRMIMSTLRGSNTSLGNEPLWCHIARSTLFVRANERFAGCSTLKTWIYYQLGDHRRASSSLISLLQTLGVDVTSIKAMDRTTNVQDSISSFASISSLKSRKIVRLRAVIECLASPSDQNIKYLSRITPQDLISCWTKEGATSQDISIQFEALQDLISVGDILYGDAIVSKFDSGFAGYYQEALQLHANNDWSLGRQQYIPSTLICQEQDPFSTKLRLCRVRCLLEVEENMGTNSTQEATHLCQEVIENNLSSPIDKAWAYFYLGSIEMIVVKKTGTLHGLWDVDRTKNVVFEFADKGKNLERAKEFFFNAAALIGNSGDDVLYRAALRSLALATGPEFGNISGESAGILVLSSIGRSARQNITQALYENQGASSLLNSFSNFDCSLHDRGERDRQVRDFLHLFAEQIPNSWYFAAPTICISGEVLITSLEKSKTTNELIISTSCVFPDEGSIGAYDEIIKPLDAIIDRSQKQLKGMDPSVVSELFSKEEAKRKWWDARMQLDLDLSNLIDHVESRYFAKLHLTANTANSIFGDDDSDELPCGNLASRFEAACDVSENQKDRDEDIYEALSKLTVPKLKSKLKDFGLSDAEMRKIRKKELIETLIEKQKLEEKTNMKEGNSSTAHTNQSCLFLVLDENLQRFPFEGMTSLKGQTICRVPSLSFVSAILLERSLSKTQCVRVNPTNASYVLDPEKNLEATQKRLLPVLEELYSSQRWEWKGVVGEIPSTSFFHDALEQDDGLLIYIGHGGGQGCFSQRQVNKMINNESGSGVRACNSSVILMGCSSGRLVSVNRKTSETLEELPLYFEPDGIALSYLCAGAPCVVGNLWDVTDKDIDRFSVALFKSFLGHSHERENQTLAKSVATAREACKLRYIVGCAPVCYGVPVQVDYETNMPNTNL